MPARVREEIVIRKFRRLARAQIGEERTGALDDRVGRLPDLIFERAVLRFGRLFQTRAVDIVEPTVIETTQAAVLEPAEREIGASMAAVPVEQSETPAVVAKE